MSNVNLVFNFPLSVRTCTLRLVTNRQLDDQHKIITAYNVLGTPCIELLITVNIYSEQRIHVIDQN